MKPIRIDPATVGAIAEMAVELRYPIMLNIIKRYNNGFIDLDESELPDVIEYLDAIVSHLRSKYPNYDEEDSDYSETDNDMYFDSLDIYCNPIKVSIAAEFGDEFLLKYRR